MPHPDEGLLHAWLDGELDAAEAARVEALVASDPSWAAAAAEARGLVAASARIVGALDRVPANVVPAAVPQRRASRSWVWRLAAVLTLMAGSAVVLERRTPELPVKTARVEPGGAAASAAAPAAAPASAPSVVPSAMPVPTAGQRGPAKVDAGEKLRNTKEAGQAEREKLAAKLPANAAAPAPPVAGGAAPSALDAAPAPRAAEAKITRLPRACFEQREPPDSAGRRIVLSAAALSDSVRLERFVVRGDTLAAVNGALRAVRIPCPMR